MRLNKVLIFVCICLFYQVSSAQDANTLSKGETLDVVTWNLEWFGCPAKSNNATSFSQQLSEVSSKIIELDADVYALQEVVNDRINGYFLEKLVEELNKNAAPNKYAGFYSDKYSFYFNTPTTDFPSQTLCYIINTGTVGLVEEDAMFSGIYNGYNTMAIEGYEGTSTSFWVSGRLPYMLQAIVSVDGKSQLIDFVNIHAKCCDNGETRRGYDADYLYGAMVNDYADDNVILLGDYNDDMEYINPYGLWYANDNEFFKDVAGEGIDHISLSNELYDEYDPLTNNEVVKTVEISDHDPVMIRLLLNDARQPQTISIEQVEDQDPGASISFSALATSGLAVEYSVLKGEIELNGNQALLNTAGEVVVQAVQRGDGAYAPAFSRVISFQVGKKSQTIDFEPIENKTVVDDPFVLVATASSGLPVVYELVEGNVTIEGDLVTIEDKGQVIIKAVQVGDHNYEAAEATQAFMVEDKDGIEDEYAAKVKLFPNPATSNVYLKLPDSTPKLIELYNISGAKIKSLQAYDEANVDVSQLCNGIYFIQIVKDNFRVTKKIQVNR
ncbi:T9SS type A sorting domain-containing protein [Plebeiibacterium marinum]|uniref:T9SS type A sorting domain-containing protein n=1 Tax=Plebeiibacterium marinum TaxID=2992111 RepID=A0AAE3SK65_9BACT|nr:T9SS type A sorting domain-containing protein [Plebeiobacterium marinum]MCW3806198.1 T9SS type A sorting domain-containing protein [Plebeiobacterium marinum]